MEEKENPSKPKVTLFGQDLNAEDNKEKKGGRKRDGERRYRCHSQSCGCGSGAWGFAVILAGVILLFNTLGLVSWGIWQFIWPFWPAFLVLVGIGIFLGKNAFARLVSSLLALAVMMVIFIYSLMRIESPMADYLPRWAKDFVTNLNINI